MPNVTVDLRVFADASANAEIFGQGPDPATYEVIDVVGANTLSAATLSGLIEFWEPSEARGTRLAALKSTAAASKATLKSQLQGVIEGPADSLNASAAAPFSASVYNDAAYNLYDSFGEVALAYIAHHMFGHVQATAAITNDQAIVAGINGDGASHARIAEQLAEKMTNAAAGGYEPAKCLQIAEAVLGQDATRAMGQDNNAIPLDVKQGLAFQPGDVVFIDLNLKDFTATLMSAAVGVTGVTAVPSAPANKSYTLKITLGA